LGQISPFVRQNWLLVSVLILASVFAVWFAAQVTLNFLYFNDPNNVDVDLKPWMSPRFIVLTYDLPRPFVFEILRLDEDADSGQRLKHVAEDLGLTLDELTTQVRAAAQDYRAAQP
jgi:hypothetical protein